MTRVKVCGLCRAEDAAYAAHAGASWLGVILSAHGPRALDAAAAARVLAVRGGAAAVGVFVDEPAARVAQVARTLSLDVVQLHGAESVEHIAEIRAAAGVQIWKAIRVREAGAARARIAAYAPHVDGILLDAFTERAAGGTGTSFDWSQLAGVRTLLGASVRLIVAGGLRAENVSQAIAQLEPDVVDVSSGVEARPGEKSHERVRAFIETVHTTRKEVSR